METRHDDGGPAFPSEQGTTPEGTWNQTYDTGMSLRDYFAAAALMGDLTRWGISHLADVREERARFIYAMTDAMLAARKENTNANKS